MTRQPLEVHGRTVEEAIAEGLAALGLAREHAAIEVLEPGSKGFLGIGARAAVVRIVAALSPIDAARLMVTEILSAGGFKADVDVEWDEATRVVAVSITGDDLGTLIGRNGRTLEALETLLNVACCRASDGARQVVLDVGGYRDRRAEALRRLTERMADTVRRTGRSVALDPMPARERRLVHLALQDAPDITTRSEGEEPARRVVIEQRSVGAR
jgi:spoIIIJ-associated protein